MFRCKNCALVIWGEVESCWSKVETSALTYILWSQVEVEISASKSKVQFLAVKTVAGWMAGKSKRTVPVQEQDAETLQMWNKLSST